MDYKTRVLVGLSLVIVFFGAHLYHILEGWSWVDSFYYVVVTLSTVGYGDISPVTTTGKFLTIFFVLAGISILAAFLETIFRKFVEHRLNKEEQKLAKSDSK